MTTDATLPLEPHQPLEGSPAWMAQQWSQPEPLVEPLPAGVAGRALIAAIAAGVLAQLLFAFQMPGLNFPIWIAIVLAAAWRYRPRSVPFDRLDAWLPIAALVFAAFVALREDGMLLAFDFVAACSLTLASVVAFGGHALTRGSWLRVIGLGAKSIAVYWIGAVYVLPGVKPLVRAYGQRRETRWSPVFRGVAIALPLLIVFGALFAAADAVLQSQLRQVFNINVDSDQITVRVLVAALAGWLFAGTLAAAWLAHRPAAAQASTATLRLGTTEALVVLVSLDVMFAAFAALQTVYLFGGVDTFAASGMTYSDYARRGFFELMIAAFLAGAVIVVIDRLISDHGIAYRLAAAALAAMTGVVALSAFVRLGLYQAANGWTELRFYALVGIAFAGIGVLLTLAAVVANRGRWLPQLLLGAGLLVAVVCNAVGPQAYVTEQNLQRAVDPSLVAPGGKTGLNVVYLSRLGADSVPALVAARDRLDPDQRSSVDSILRDQAVELRRDAVATGWQSWNLARQRALDALVAAGY